MGILAFVIVLIFHLLLIFILKKLGYEKFAKVAIFLSVIAIFSYDIIITNILALYYCNTSPNPKTKIEKKVEYPISIYWEDNVYSGFSKEDRELMIINYLDGVHLKTMALNGNDAKIYVYSLEKPIWNDIKKELSEKELYNIGFKKYINEVMKSEKIYTKTTMPKINYTVTFNEVKLNSFVRKFLYSDETKVIQNSTNKVIAYNKRYMRFFYNILPDVALGNIYYYSEPVCGDSYFWFDYHVFEFKGVAIRNKHQLDLNKYLYKKEGK